MKRTSALILTAAMVFTLASCGVPKKQGTTEDHYRLTFSMHTPADTPIGNQFQAMFDDIEEKTNGHVEINLYGSGTLASSADVVDMVADGACDIGWVFTSFYYGQYPLTDVIAVPGKYPPPSRPASFVLHYGRPIQAFSLAIPGFLKAFSCLLYTSRCV